MRALLYPFLASFGAALVLVPVARAIAIQAGAVAQPKQDRWHQRPTALFGGVAIALAVLGTVAYFDGIRSKPALLACGAVMFLFGLADDLLGVKPATKLIAQIALGSVFLFFHYRLGWSHSLTLDSVLTLLWVVGIVNAFNLLDNMDGLCAGVACIAGLAFMANFYPVWPGTDAFLAARYAAALSGAALGFLVYNAKPASIFMGDSGSLFLGLSLAALALRPGVSLVAPVVPAAGLGSSLPLVVLAPLAILLVPIFDTTLVTAARLLSGRSASVGGRDHSSHRLVAIGLSERAAVAVLWGMALIAGSVGVAIRHSSESWSVLIAFLFLVAVVIFAIFLARVKVYDKGDLSRLTEGRMTPVMQEIFYRRRAAEVLLDFCLVLIAYYSAYRLHFDDRAFVTNFFPFINTLPIVVGLQMVTFFVVGSYRGAWKHFGLNDAVTFGKATLVGAVLAQVVVLYLYRFQGYSRAVFALYAVLLFVLLASTRASFRLIADFVNRRRQTGARLVIYGAGDGGVLALRELLAHPSITYRVVGFIDDDPLKKRLRLHGYPVLGGHDRLIALIEQNEVDAVVISARTFDPFRQRQLELLCRSHEITLSRLRVNLEALVSDAAS